MPVAEARPNGRHRSGETRLLARLHLPVGFQGDRQSVGVVKQAFADEVAEKIRLVFVLLAKRGKVFAHPYKRQRVAMINPRLHGEVHLAQRIHILNFQILIGGLPKGGQDILAVQALRGNV